MIPLPSVIYYALTFRLQVLASSLSSSMLDLAKIPNVREGNVIYLPNFTVGVVEACSGIRSLISLLAFAAFFGYVSPMNRISRWILLLAAVPIAIFVNALRIGGTGCVGNYANPKYAEGFYHTFSGWLLFLGCLGSVAVLSHILTRLSRANKKEKQA
jgi:exosortase